MLGFIATVGAVTAPITVFVQWHADVATIPAALAREFRDTTGEAYTQTQGQQEQQWQQPSLTTPVLVAYTEHL